MRKKKLFSIVILLTLSLLLVYPLSKELMQHKTEKFSFVEYTVQPGDTLWSIAREHNTSGKDIRELIYEIRKVNDISPMIQPGQELKIPVKTKDGGVQMNRYITVAEMKEYLNRFSDDDNISFVVINSKERIRFIPKELTLIGDIPAIFMDTTETKGFDIKE